VQKNTDPDFRCCHRPALRAPGNRAAVVLDRRGQRFDPILDLMYDYADAMKLDVDTLIHESGAAQLEVNFTHADAMDLADQVFLFKRTMREAAMRHGVYATFLAKPMENEPGSAMHIHQSLVRVRRAATCSPARPRAGEFSPVFGHYLGGLQKYVPQAMAFFAPNVNSYRRLVFGEVSPSNVHWGFDNRTCGLRVPLDTPENMRVESRFAGSDANPYLAMAATLACGLLGIRERLAGCAGDRQRQGTGLQPAALAGRGAGRAGAVQRCRPCWASASAGPTSRSSARNTRPFSASSARGSASSCC
jgi:glutamine synthetase